MLRFDTLLKRLRNKGAVKPRDRVQTGDGFETMTPTQACRFRELQVTRFEGNRRKARSHYSLKEAARLLRSEAEEILQAAADGRLQCLVMSGGLRGHWLAAGHGELRLPVQPAPMPRYLALSPADCRQIAAYGGVKVWELEYPADSVPDDGAVPAAARFILREPMWVDRTRIVLSDPLPK